jgi:phosphoenolpyruvate carboxylase
MLLSEQLHEREQTTGIDKTIIEQHMMETIDALLRTSPVGMARPTPVQEANTLIALFDHTLFDLVPNVYQRFNDLIMGEDAAMRPPVTPAFIKPGSWIASDRDGNPNVTAKTTCEVAEMLRAHVLERYAAECMRVGYLLTCDNLSTPPSPALKGLWHHMDQMGEELCAPMSELVVNEYHRVVM